MGRAGKSGGTAEMNKAYAECHKNEILNLIITKPGINLKMLIEDSGFSPATVSKALKEFRDNKLIYSERHGKEVGNYPAKAENETSTKTNAELVVTEPEKEENEVERYPDHKNDEGYNDLTAAPTIKKLDDIFGTFDPGAVWTLSTAYGADADYLVLRSYKGWVTGMMLQDDLQQYSPVYCVPVSMKDKRYVDCRRILTKPSKYFIEKKYDIPNFDRVRSKICYLLGIEPEVVEKIVEKPVEVTKEIEVVKEVPVEVIKEVEKPVEVIKEVVKEVQVPIEVEKTVDAVDTALLRQKADIYERIARQFLNSIASVAEEVER